MTDIEFRSTYSRSHCTKTRIDGRSHIKLPSGNFIVAEYNAKHKDGVLTEITNIKCFTDITKEVIFIPTKDCFNFIKEYLTDDIEDDLSSYCEERDNG